MTDWKQHHADEAEKALDHGLVQDQMEQFASNMGFELRGLPLLGLGLIASAAAQVARANALGCRRRVRNSGVGAWNTIRGASSNG